MANKRQLAILKKGSKPWNEWRKKNPRVVPDLREAPLEGANLYKAILRGADMHGAHLNGATLQGADLSGANLSGAELDQADLLGAILSEADLSRTSLFKARVTVANLTRANLNKANLTASDLEEVNLRGANLNDTDLIKTDLTNADLRGAILSNARMFRTNLSGAKLRGANLNEARLIEVIFANVDLSEVDGLYEVMPGGPSMIGIDTLYKSKGKIPEVFLRGCGIPEEIIAIAISLRGKAIQFYSCFVSYSSEDETFAKRVHADLQVKGVRVWFAPEDLKIGDKFRSRIDEAIRVYDKLLIMLSESSINSTWVEKEVETAFEKERKEKRTVLFPVRLDDAVMKTEQAWAADIRRTRHIGDMSAWKEHDSYQAAFDRLLRDLQASEAK